MRCLTAEQIREIRMKNDREMMQHPLVWPAWPYLALKRYPDKQGPPEIGYMVDGRPNTVYLGNIFDANPVTDPKKEYDSLDAVLDDGWLVD